MGFTVYQQSSKVAMDYDLVTFQVLAAAKYKCMVYHN